MAKPMTATQFKNILVKEGVTVAEIGDWKNHNRNSKGAWGPLHGVMIHHTAGSGSGMVQYCYDGDAELPGPLCQGVIGKDGTVSLVGWGRANHAGGGDPAVLESVINESYGDQPPATHQHQGSSGAVDGNAHFVGFECINKGDGKDPWPDAQVDAVIRVSAAICRFYGWSAKSVIGHKEWSDYKSDPKGPGNVVDMVRLRAAVQALIDGGAPTGGGLDPKPEPQPVPQKPVVSAAHIRAAARRDPGLPQGGTTFGTESKLVEQALADLGFLSRDWVDGSFGTRTVAAYRRYQLYRGFVGADADGIPGKTSLTWLGQRTGLFTTTD